MRDSEKKTLHVLAMALLIIGAASVSVRAQEQPPAPQQNQVASEPQRVGPGRQLAHESREAAGEEKDEMDEFKQSSAVQLVARLTGLSLQQSYWLSVILNFAVIARVIIWAGRKYLAGNVSRSHRCDSESNAGSAEGQRRSAQKLAEIESRLTEAGR